jgi:hypothetical protein
MTSHSKPQASHLNLALTQALAQINSKISSRREWGGVVNALGGAMLVVPSAVSEEGVEGYKYLSPKN